VDRQWLACLPAGRDIRFFTLRVTTRQGGILTVREIMFYTYVVKSERDGTTYIGSTEDLIRRVREHNNGKTKSIRHKLPVKLVYYEAYEKKTQARKREIELKKNSSAKEKLFKRLF